MGAILPFNSPKGEQEHSNRVTFDTAEIHEMAAAVEAAAALLIRASVRKKGQTVSDAEVGLCTKTLLHTVFLRTNVRRT